jgi:hypothetical protein
MIKRSLNPAPAGDEVDDQDDDGQDQQDVDEATHRVGADQAKEPKHQQNNEYCPQHNFSSGLGFPSFVPRRIGALVFRNFFCGLWAILIFELVGRDRGLLVHRF